jgi:hypothetical protein
LLYGVNAADQGLISKTTGRMLRSIRQDPVDSAGMRVFIHGIGWPDLLLRPFQGVPVNRRTKRIQALLASLFLGVLLLMVSVAASRKENGSR